MKKVAFLSIISFLFILCCGISTAIENMIDPDLQPNDTESNPNTAQADVSATHLITRTPNDLNTPTQTQMPALTFTPTPTTTAQQPETAAITDIYMIDTQNGWALAGSGGNKNQLLRTEDGGTSWRTVFLMPENLTNAGATAFVCSFPDARTAWLTPFGEDFIPADTIVFHTLDGGASWESSQPLPTYAVGGSFNVFLEALDADQAWLFTQVAVLGTGINYTQRLFHTVDGGKNWEEMVLILNGINGMDFVNDTVGLLASELDGFYEAPIPAIFYRTNDSGKNWEEINLPIPSTEFGGPYDHCQAAHPSLFNLDARGLMVSCYYDWLENKSDHFYYSTTNGGDTWGIHALPGGNKLLMLDQNIGWSYGPDAEMHTTTDGGLTWRPIELGITGQIHSVSFVSEKLGWLTIKLETDGISLYRTADGGFTWERLE